MDGVKPNLICTSLGGKVFIHSPHDNTKDTSSEYYSILINKNKNNKFLFAWINDIFMKL